MQRPSADMLAKDKWLAKLKVPNSVLRDLIPSYRQSLPGLDSQASSTFQILLNFLHTVILFLTAASRSHLSVPNHGHSATKTKR
jgi:hypothetical protein